MPSDKRPFVYSKVIKISRDDMRLLRSGKKTCTVRVGNASVASPEIMMSDGRTNARIRIVSVDNSRTFAELSLQDALAEGFSSTEELAKDLRKYYPRVQPSDPITVIYFEMVGDESTPSLFPDTL